MVFIPFSLMKTDIEKIIQIIYKKLDIYIIEVYTMLCNNYLTKTKCL